MRDEPERRKQGESTEPTGESGGNTSTSRPEFARRVKQKDHFLTTVLKEPKLFWSGTSMSLKDWQHNEGEIHEKSSCGSIFVAEHFIDRMRIR